MNNAEYLVACVILGLATSSAAAESPSSVTPQPTAEPSYSVGASYLASRHVYMGHGVLIEGARRIGRLPVWARVAVGGGRLLAPLGGGDSINDPGDGQFARVAIGAEARASSGEGAVFGGIDLGYEYFGYDRASTMGSDAMSESTHAPLMTLRGGVELGKPRVRLRGAVELVGFDQPGIAFALGVLVGI